jgi:hypothetical protein
MSDTQKEFQTSEESPLKTMWFETHLGVKYEMPDMLAEHISNVCRLLDGSNKQIFNITVLNVSEAVLVLPRRIIKKAGVGDRCFWEAS